MPPWIRNTLIGISDHFSLIMVPSKPQKSGRLRINRGAFMLNYEFFPMLQKIAYHHT
jgi:hypothetical protein